MILEEHSAEAGGRGEGLLSLAAGDNPGQQEVLRKPEANSSQLSGKEKFLSRGKVQLCPF